MRPDAVLVESKAGAAPGLADPVLRSLGVPETRLSEYCTRTALARPDLPAPDLRPALRRWFPRDGDHAPAA